jgi:hypothetical protein
LDDTSLVTLCKGFGTENLESFRRYLPNAYKDVIPPIGHLVLKEDVADVEGTRRSRASKVRLPKRLSHDLLPKIFGRVAKKALTLTLREALDYPTRRR